MRVLKWAHFWIVQNHIRLDKYENSPQRSPKIGPVSHRIEERYKEIAEAVGHSVIGTIFFCDPGTDSRSTYRMA
jgi:hypothetical protein